MDIKELKNNDLRGKFLDNRDPDQGWYLWVNQPEVDRKFYRSDIEDTAFICEVEKCEFQYPKRHTKWYTKRYFIVPTCELEKGIERAKPFSAYESNKTGCIERLKYLGRRK